MKNFYQSGRSMIEMLGVLAIVGILSVGGFNLVNKMQTSSTINEVLDEVSTLASKVRTVARDYEGTSGAQINSYVKKAKAVPDTFLYTEDESNPDNISFTGAGDVDYSIYYVHIVFENGEENKYDIAEKFDKLPKENDVFNHFL